MQPHEQAWQLISHHLLIKDRWLEVYENAYELPDGSRLERYHALRERDGVVIVALTPQQHVLMVRQYRPGIGAVIYELPAGFLEDGEQDILQRAQTELREETGYVASAWHSLGTLHDPPSRMQKTTHAFLALDVRKQTEQDEDQTEFVEYERIPLHQVQELIQDDQITSSVMIAALFKAVMRLQQEG